MKFIWNDLLWQFTFGKLMMSINFEITRAHKLVISEDCRCKTRSIYYKKIIKKIIVECVSYIEAIIILMYNNQPTKFQIKIHNGSIKKSSNEKKFILWFSSSFFLCSFCSLSHSLIHLLTHSLHCFILHIIFHFFILFSTTENRYFENIHFVINF